MPRYVIERQFFIPMYEHICVEALDLAGACDQALDDWQKPWGDNAVLSYDDARPTTIARAVEIPDNLFPELRPEDEGDPHALSDILYQSGLDPLRIPAEFADERDPEADQIGFF